MSKLTIFLLLINFLIMRLVSPKLSQMGLVLIFVKYFIDTGVFARTNFTNGVFEKSDIFFWQYKGDYRKLNSHFKKLSELYSKYSFNKNLWKTFGIYYDDPKKTDSSKCRAIVGFQYVSIPNKKENLMEEKDLINFMKEEGFKHKEIPLSKCVVARYAHVNFLSIIFAIQKFYSNLEKKIKEAAFLKEFGLEDKEPKFNCTFELYKDDYLVFGFPLENEKKFFVYSE